MYPKSASLRFIVTPQFAVRTATLLSVLLHSGCTSYESTASAHVAREYLTEDLEDQIVFNLIRGSQGLPFSHYDVSSAQAVVSSKIFPEAGGGRVSTRNRYPKATSRAVETSSSGVKTTITDTIGAVSSAAETVARPFSYNVAGERANTVTVNVAPVFDEPKIYAAYVEFLNLGPKTTGSETTRLGRKVTPSAEPAMTVVAKTETTKIAQDESGKKVGNTVIETQVDSEKISPPPPGTPRIEFDGIHSIVSSDKKPASSVYLPRTLRRWEGRWYYVPVQYRPEFSDLCLAVVARGTLASGSPVSAGSVKKKSEQTKALEQFGSELMRLNSEIR